MDLSRRGVIAGAAAALPGAAFCASESAVRDLLAARIVAARKSPHAVAGILQGKSRRIVVDGGLDGDTVFQIASLTKIFTALLLAQMVGDGEVAMEDSVARYLPPDVHAPGITLADIVTYAPGLPGWPRNMPPLDPAKPFPDYPVARLYEALAQPLKYEPDTHYEYSNFGYGLLAVALARRAGRSFEELLVTRICAPLGMDATRITPTAAMQARLAPGHDEKLAEIAGWRLPEAFAGAGALHSTVNDMLLFLEACTGRRKTALSPAFASLLDKRRSADAPDTEAAAGWFVSTRGSDQIVWKDGATVGYSSFLGYAPQGNDALVILTDGQCGGILTPLGKHLLKPEFPLPA